MKVAIVYDAVFPFVKGGAELRNQEIAHRLAQLGYDVHLLGMKFWDGADQLQTPDGVTLHGVCPARPLYVNDRRSIPVILHFSLRLARYLSRQAFDIVDCASTPIVPAFVCWFYCLVKRRPLIITWHAYWEDYWYTYLGWMGGVAKLIERVTTRLPRFSIAASEHTRQLLLEQGVAADAVVTIHAGISDEEITATAPAAIRSDILFASRLTREKRPDMVLHVVHGLGIRGLRVRCCMAGDGPERPRLEAQARDLGIESQVVFAGEVSHKDVYALMRSSRVFVFPSVNEGFGIVVSEALACGLPVVAVNARYNAAAMLIQDGHNGFLRPLDPDKLTDAVATLLLNEPQRLTMSHNASESARQFRWEESAAQTASVYEALGQRSAKR